MVGLLVTALVILLIIAIAWWAITNLSLPAPVHMVAVVVVAIVLILIVVHYLLPFAGHGGL